MKLIKTYNDTNTQINTRVNENLFQFNLLLHKIPKIQNFKSITLLWYNITMLQCYGIFLTSHNLTCTRIKNTPQSRSDSAHLSTLQEPSTPQSVKWGRDPGIICTNAKTQDWSILSIPSFFC